VHDENLRDQPPPETKPLRGELEPRAADFTALWLQVPRVRQARGVLWASLAPCVIFLSSLLVPEVSVAVGVAPLALTCAALLVLSAARGGWARRQVERLGPGSLTYVLDEQALTCTSSRHGDRIAWSAVRRFQETPSAFVLFPARGGMLPLFKRAFDGQTSEAGVRFRLRRRLEERSALNPGLVVAAVFGGLVIFLSGWHFFSIGSPEEQRRELAELEKRNRELDDLAKDLKKLGQALGGAGSETPEAGVRGEAKDVDSSP
jgi:hypothetical protein